jgi:hypothetical protein
MGTFFITVQLGLFLLALPLLLLSVRTSRGQRGAHSAFTAGGAVLSLAALLLLLASLSVIAGEEEIDVLLTVLPPLLTMIGCAWVIRRGVEAQSRPRRSRPARTAAVPPLP